MGFQDGAYLPPPRASSSTTCLKNCGRGESPGTTTSHKTVVGGRQGHTACKIPSLQQSLFSCQLNFVEITRSS